MSVINERTTAIVHRDSRTRIDVEIIDDRPILKRNSANWRTQLLWQRRRRRRLERERRRIVDLVRFGDRIGGIDRHGHSVCTGSREPSAESPTPAKSRSCLA